MLFLVVGFVSGALGWIRFAPDDPATWRPIEVALFTVLFVEGGRLDLPTLRRGWQMPARALGVGLPVTLIVTAALAHWVVGVDWTSSLLIGAALSPTDPVFATALVGQEKVPLRLRELLNIESGLNDGIALPILAFVVAAMTHSRETPLKQLAEALGGLAMGPLLAWVGVALRRRWFALPSEDYARLYSFAVGLLVFGFSHALGANEFLAAFAAGVTLGSLGDPIRRDLATIGEPVSEVLKLAGVFVFGSLFTIRLLTHLSAADYVFVALALLLPRPLALLVSLVPSPLTRREWIAAAWFGPKGFASMYYGYLIVATPGLAHEPAVPLIAAVVAASILVHSSTDVAVARWFDAPESPTRCV